MKTEKELLNISMEALCFIYSYSYQNSIPLHKSYIDMDKKDLLLLASLIENNRIMGILYTYGHTFLICLYHYFISVENYERCQDIINEMEDHNKYCDDNLTTEIRPGAKITYLF